MTEIIDLNSKRPPVVYRVTIVHHYDDTLEFRVEDVADDERSREAVMSAFRRISGADEEIEKLRTDVRHAVFADCEYAAEMDEQNVALREEITRLREELQKDFNAMRVFARYRELEAEIETLRGLLREAHVKMDANNLWSNLRHRVAAAIREGRKDEN